ncbi:nadp-specific isocitrate dehydrogenase [Holotrichia oblita]|uniref:Nadp-specific isocitrate dehydrogenase n=3 Tax=Holotrichia oblita TaxID=644536 RepID=A0ACB9T386_HOLOL|nr:nadp-specific isocitrate dehydrogenase [Holotrichia oblita]
MVLHEGNRTENEIVSGAIEAIKRYSAGVKCPTITPNEKMIKDYKLKQIIFPSPNVMIRSALDGTQLREPIICKGVSKFVPKWSRPILMCRHTFGDQYGGKDIMLNEPGTVSLLYTTDSGQFYKYDFDIRSKGVAMLTYNTEDSIKTFAESCFKVALERGYPLYFTSKFTHLKKYDQMFVNVFQEMYNKKYKPLFEKAKLKYEHRLVDDMAAYAIKSTGGFVWALKSYDGDILSDIIGQGFGSMGMMTSTFLSHDGKTVLTEPAHGTITRHYKRYQKGKSTSTNPLSTIFAWTRCLRHRAQLDSNYELLQFTNTIEKCTKETVEEGHLTRDLALCTYGHNFQDNICISTDDIINIIADKLDVQFEKLFNEEEIEVKMTPS